MLPLSALLLGWNLCPPQIRGQVGERNMAGLSLYLPPPNDFQIHKDWVSEWILGFSRERAEIAEFIPAPSGYISDNIVAFGLSCNFLEDKARCDRWRSWWKSCRGRGHVAPPSNLRRDWSRQGHKEGPATFMHICCRNTDCKTHQNPGQRHELSICKLMLVFMLSCRQLLLFRYFSDRSVCASFFN